jgi:hypothetical protein
MSQIPRRTILISIDQAIEAMNRSQPPSRGRKSSVEDVVEEPQMRANWIRDTNISTIVSTKRARSSNQAYVPSVDRSAEVDDEDEEHPSSSRDEHEEETRESSPRSSSTVVEMRDLRITNTITRHQQMIKIPVATLTRTWYFIARLAHECFGFPRSHQIPSSTIMAIQRAIFMINRIYVKKSHFDIRHDSVATALVGYDSQRTVTLNIRKSLLDEFNEIIRSPNAMCTQYTSDFTISIDDIMTHGGGGGSSSTDPMVSILIHENMRTDVNRLFRTSISKDHDAKPIAVVIFKKLMERLI